MSTAELKRIVDDATAEEQQFLFVCLAEKLRAQRPDELSELDQRAAEYAKYAEGRKSLRLGSFGSGASPE